MLTPLTLGWALLLAAASSLPVATLTTALDDTSAPGTLFKAFTDNQTDEILLTTDNYALSKSHWAAYNESHPYRLQRDLLIRSNVQPLGQLDFGFMQGKVLVGSGVTVTLERVALRNVRKLGGFSLDFFLGEANSTVILRDVVRVKAVCPPLEDALRAAATFASWPPWPPNAVAAVNGVCVATPDGGRNVCYQDSVHFISFTMLSRNLDPDAGDASYAGYVLHMQNTTRVCDHYVNVGCVAARGQDTCIADLISELLGGGGGDGGGGGRPAAPRGVVAGVAAAAGALAVAAVALCVCCRRRMARCLASPCGKLPRDPEPAGRTSGAGGGPSEEPLMLQGSGTPGQSLAQEVRLGVLIGTGSFGRVFRGRWHGTDVAVKIVSCSPDELPKVLKEAEVMMQLAHPNVVRALSCSVFDPDEQQRAMRAARRRSESADSGSTAAAARSRRPAAAAELAGAPAAPASAGSLASHPSHPSSGATQRQTSSSHSGSQRAAAARAAQPAAIPQSCVVNILPQLLPAAPAHSSAAAASAQGASKGGQGPQGSTSAEAAAAAAAAAAPVGASSGGGSSSTSSSEAARQLFAKVLQPVQQHQQQQQEQLGQDQRQQGPQAPGTRVRSREGVPPPRLVASPMSSAAQTAGGSSAPLAQLLLPGGQASAGSTAVGLLLASGSGSEGADAATRSSRSSAAHSLPLHGSGPGALGEGRDGGGWAGAISSALRSQPGGSSRAGTATSSSSSAAAAAAASAIITSSSASGGHSQEAAAAAAAAAAPGGRQGAGVVGWLQRQRGGSPLGGSKAAAVATVAEAAAPRARPSTSSSDEQDQREVQVWLVLELCTGGTLKDAVSLGRLRTDSQLEMAKLLSMLLDAATGMAFLHSRNVLHGDLKAANVLLQKSVHGSYGLIAKISDFGLASTLMDGATHRSTATMGTLTHSAPEVLKSGRMSPASDVFSFGILMWEALTNRQAHEGLHYGTVVERVVLQGERPPIPPELPEGIALLMRSCWDADPSKRPTFPQVVRCIELLLDNLTSDSEGRISEGNEQEEEEEAGGGGGGGGGTDCAGPQGTAAWPGAAAAPPGPPAGAAAVAAGAGPSGQGLGRPQPLPQRPQMQDPAAGSSRQQLAAAAAAAAAAAQRGSSSLSGDTLSAGTSPLTGQWSSGSWGQRQPNTPQPQRPQLAEPSARGPRAQPSGASTARQTSSDGLDGPYVSDL